MTSDSSAARYPNAELGNPYARHPHLGGTREPGPGGVWLCACSSRPPVSWLRLIPQSPDSLCGRHRGPFEARSSFSCLAILVKRGPFSPLSGSPGGWAGLESPRCSVTQEGTLRVVWRCPQWRDGTPRLPAVPTPRSLEANVPERKGKGLSCRCGQAATQ